MADIWLDVDTVLSDVPVNIMPLVDDTDFKTIEDAVVYNAAGMALFWNFITTAGSQSSTAVTPSNSGNYIWDDAGTSGFYALQMPASGGASINNDTEGFGWFSGVCDGVLPWRGPVVGFRAAALNNAFVDGTTVPATQASVDTIDALADEIKAAVVTNATGVDIAADIIALKAETATILVDTNELQTNQGNWATATGFSTHAPTAIVSGGAINTTAGAVDNVTLVATTTTNTDMVTASDATAAKQDQIIAATITNATGVDIAADIIALKAETATILVDTNELQTNQGNWATATGFSTHAPTAIVSGGAINTTAGAVDNVTLVATTTTNTDMVSVAGSATEAKQDQLIAATITNAAGTDVAADIIALQATVDSMDADVEDLWRLSVLESGTIAAASGSTDTIVKTPETDADGQFDGDWFTIRDATTPFSTETKRISAYVAASGQFTLASALTFTPDENDEYWVTPGHLSIKTAIDNLQVTVDELNNPTVDEIRLGFGLAVDNLDTLLNAIIAQAAPTAVANAQAVWNETLALHLTPGSAGKALTDIGTGATAEEVRIEMDANSTALSTLNSLITALEDASLTDIKTQVDTALTDIDLQYLVSAAYDGTTKPGDAASIWNTLLDAVATARFTAASLTNAPTGGAGTGDWTTTEKEQIRHLIGFDGTSSAPLSGTTNLEVANSIPTAAEIRIEIDSNSTSIAAIPTTTLAEADIRTAVGLAAADLDTQLSAADTKLDTISTAVVTTNPAQVAALVNLSQADIRTALGLAVANLDTQLAGLGTDLGTGANTVTITVEDTALNPLENVSVRLVEGVTTVFGTTDAAGQVVFALDDATYDVNATKPGYTPITGGTAVVSGVTGVLLSLGASSVTPPAAASLSVGVLDVYDNAGVLEPNIWFTVQLISGPGIDGQSHDTEARVFQADVNGYLEVTGLVIGALYSIYRGDLDNVNGSSPATFVVPNAPSFELPSGILGYE